MLADTTAYSAYLHYTEGDGEARACLGPEKDSGYSNAPQHRSVLMCYWTVWYLMFDLFSVLNKWLSLAA